MQRSSGEGVVTLQCGRFELQFGRRTLIMGIVNVTPDSFSDGGLHLATDDAVAAAWRMVEHGADMIDIGGESARPGHQPISAEEEMQRILPVLERLQEEQFPLPISIDTYKAEVAEAALSVGASIINDIWGLQRDERMAEVAARFSAPVIVMHNQNDTHYPNGVMNGLHQFFQESFHRAEAAGLSKDRLILDPGFGFGKNAEQNLEVTRSLRDLTRYGCPILFGPSRKSTIGKLLNLPVTEREEGTAAFVAMAIDRGADIVRVHDVRAMQRVVRVCDAVVRDWRPDDWQP